jgi:hypothetical protein
MPEQLPGAATRLLVDGYDSPVLRDLAGLDLGPCDPRDARDAFNALLEEQGYAVESDVERTTRASLLLATAIAERLITIEVGLNHFAQLYAATGIRDDDCGIGGLLYEAWTEGSARRRKSIAKQVLAEASRIAARRRPDDSVLAYIRTTA